MFRKAVRQHHCQYSADGSAMTLWRCVSFCVGNWNARHSCGVTNLFFSATLRSHDRTPPSRQLRRRLAATPRSLHGTISAISIILSQQIDDNDVSHNHYIQSTFPWSFSVPSAMCLSGVCFLVIQLVVLHEYGTCCMHSSRICQLLIALATNCKHLRCIVRLFGYQVRHLLIAPKTSGGCYVHVH